MTFNILLLLVSISHVTNNGTGTPLDKKTVFLGGSCEGRLWRTKVIEQLSAADIKSFNPRLGEGEEWGEDDKIKEDQHKDTSLFSIFVINNDSYGLVSTIEIYQLAMKKKRVYVHIENDESEVKWAQGTNNKRIFQFRDYVKRMCETEKLTNVKFFPSIDELVKQLISDHKKAF